MNKNYITKYSFGIHHCYLQESVKPSQQIFIIYLVLDYTPTNVVQTFFHKGREVLCVKSYSTKNYLQCQLTQKQTDKLNSVQPSDLPKLMLKLHRSGWTLLSVKTFAFQFTKHREARHWSGQALLTRLVNVQLSCSAVAQQGMSTPPDTSPPYFSFRKQNYIYYFVCWLKQIF